MEEEHKALQELRSQVEMMCQELSFTPIINSSETVNQSDSNAVTPTTFPSFSSEHHNPYDLPNQFHKDYNFNVVDLRHIITGRGHIQLLSFKQLSARILSIIIWRLK